MEWCHGDASKQPPYPCCDKAEQCTQVDQYDYVCKKVSPPHPTCTDPYKPCTADDTCCPDIHGTSFNCVKWGEALMCRDKAHETCAKDEEWCHGAASKGDPYPCCTTGFKCQQVDQYNFKCEMPKA
jgi:hypothetical protein